MCAVADCDCNIFIWLVEADFYLNWYWFKLKMLVLIDNAYSEWNCYFDHSCYIEFYYSSVVYFEIFLFGLKLVVFIKDCVDLNSLFVIELLILIKVAYCCLELLVQIKATCVEWSCLYCLGLLVRNEAVWSECSYSVEVITLALLLKLLVLIETAGLDQRCLFWWTLLPIGATCSDWSCLLRLKLFVKIEAACSDWSWCANWHFLFFIHFLCLNICSIWSTWFLPCKFLQNKKIEKLFWLNITKKD